MDTKSSDPSSEEASPISPGYFYNFESTLAPWVPGAETGLSRQFLARETSSCDRLLTGTNYADLKGGSSIPGTEDFFAFMQTGFPSSSGADVNDVTVKFDAQSIAGCDGCKVSVCISNSPISDFLSQANGVGTLTSSWGRYGHSEAVTLNENNAIYVALGWAGTPSRGGGPNVGFDCINVDIGP
ncbi:MAG TPA: hypothetical protein VEX13_02055 [Chloroflexia bacterium]|nr:hypothetical protein [Chloroflexia bacterium]